MDRLGGEPLIRVGIVVDRDSAVLSATGQYRVVGADGAVIAVVDAYTPIRVYTDDERARVRVARAGRADAVSAAAPVLVRPERATDLVVVGGRRYRGEALLARGSVGVTVVNRVPLEAYLLSVVALELGFRNPTDRQAVLAQAVAARTYAMRYRGRREALGFDVFPTDADQVYSGVDSELPEVTEAVRATTGEILTWNGRPIEALFHSTCGWSTEAADQVFQNRGDTPYLRAVSDRTGEGPRDFYCAISPKFRWTEEWDAAQLAQVARRAMEVTRGSNGTGDTRVTDVEASRVTPTGRVAELTFVTASGRVAVPQGRIRDVLRPAGGGQLPSTMFQLHPERSGNGLTRLVAAGAGYGHGVGMCQFGAVGRARAGHGYREILAAYYHGTTLEKTY